MTITNQHATIYKPERTATQSGKANSKRWVLFYRSQQPKEIEPIMGWTASEDMLNQEVRLSFDTQEQAENYAKKHDIAYDLLQPTHKKFTKRTYSENFR